MISSPSPKFPAGQILITSTAQQQLSASEVQQALRRHLAGDWGDCEPDDAATNEDALLHGERLLSVYHTAESVTFWIITEADRSATTVLMPDDY
ncbi:hypothetical protein [Planctomicrobium sp. SH527]|uniref:hypothetical protein n=1 Tax=Planctomicrobium sp. SH527 TaxID=3448123 RepID=UPI003F5AF586